MKLLFHLFEKERKMLSSWCFSPYRQHTPCLSGQCVLSLCNGYCRPSCAVDWPVHCHDLEAIRSLVASAWHIKHISCVFTILVRLPLHIVYYLAHSQTYSFDSFDVLKNWLHCRKGSLCVLCMCVCLNWTVFRCIISGLWPSSISSKCHGDLGGLRSVDRAQMLIKIGVV